MMMSTLPGGHNDAQLRWRLCYGQGIETFKGGGDLRTTTSVALSSLSFYALTRFISHNTQITSCTSVRQK